MSSSLRVDDMAREWNESLRLRVGVYLILGIAWFYGLLLLRDANLAKRTDWGQIEERIKRAKSTAAVAEWGARAIDAKAAVQEWEQLLWKEGSIGLAQAAMQESVARSLLAAGVGTRNLRSAIVEQSAATSDALVPVRVRAQVEFKPSTLYPWLHTVTKGVYEKKPALLVDALTIRAGINGYAEVELTGYAVRGAPAASPAVPTAASGALPSGARP